MTPGDIAEGSRAISPGPFPLQLGSWKPPRPGADQSHSPGRGEHCTGGPPLGGIWGTSGLRWGWTRPHCQRTDTSGGPRCQCGGAGRSGCAGTGHSLWGAGEQKAELSGQGAVVWELGRRSEFTGQPQGLPRKPQQGSVPMSHCHLCLATLSHCPYPALLCASAQSWGPWEQPLGMECPSPSPVPWLFSFFPCSATPFGLPDLPAPRFYPIPHRAPVFPRAQARGGSGGGPPPHSQ